MTLEALHADILGPVAHGYFTRHGGASSGIFEGLNCGTGSSDQTEAVQINRARVAEAMGGPLHSVHQVHSADVIVIDGPLCDATDETGAPRRADALVTAVPGQVLTVLTADCQPVLFHDSESGVVGAAHAGWKGALDGILEATIEAMEGLGAIRPNIRAAIGPSISQRAYEVGPEFPDPFLDADAEAGRFSRTEKATDTCSTCPPMGCGGCAGPGCRRNGPGIVPIPTPHASIPIAARPMRVRRITGV